MRVPRPVLYYYEFAREIIREYGHDNGSLVSAALGFYIFLSLIPLLLLAIAGLGYLLGSPDRAKQVVFDYVKEYSPTLAAGGGVRIRQIVEEIIRGRDAATGIGSVFFLWSGASLMVTLEQAINVAWDITEQRRYLVSRLLGLGMLLATGLLFLTSFAVTAALDAVRNANIRLLGLAPSSWPWVWSFLGYLIPLVVSIAAFALIYKVLPNARVPLRAALCGGVFAGVLWELAKVGFSLYLSTFATDNAVYGSLGGVILLMVWINYSAVVTILGAEAASGWAKRHLTAQS